MTNILILGAGFGGIGAVLKLARKLKNKKDFKITLIDRNNFHLFTPSLYEVATVYGLIEDKFAKYLRGSVAIPITQIFENKKVDFIQAEIKEINLKERFVTTNSENKFDFDYLIIALGGETEFYGIQGVQDYAFNFKSIDNAVAIYKKIKEIYDKFCRSRSSHTETPSEISINIIGGGFTGVELAAELGCCITKIINDQKLDKKCTMINLIEAGPIILPAIIEKARKKIENRLKTEMVQIQINSPVSEVGPNYIKIKDREELVISDLTIWAGGVRGSKLLENLGLKLTKKGSIEVNEFLQTKNLDDSTNDKIFAVGDNATFIDPSNQKPVPAMAYTAYDESVITAKNIINHLKNHKLNPYKPFYDAWIAPVGGKWAYFHYKGFNISGFIGYLLRQVVDLRHFLRILSLNKALALFFKDLVMFTKND